MNWLARLKEIERPQAATLPNLEKSSDPTSVGFVGQCPDALGDQDSAFVGFVGSTVGISGDAEERTMPEPLAIPCTAKQVPDASDVNDLHSRRRAWFREQGLEDGQAGQTADALSVRDGELDERRLCLECRHLSGNARARRCGRWREAGTGSLAIPAELVTLLQRCRGFEIHPICRPGQVVQISRKEEDQHAD